MQAQRKLRRPKRVYNILFSIYTFKVKKGNRKRIEASSPQDKKKIVKLKKKHTKNKGDKNDQFDLSF